MNIAALDKDRELMKRAYQSLRNIAELTIDDKIVYTRLNCPILFLILRLIRKIKR